MILLNNKIINAMPQFPADMQADETKFITALLVMEHGVVLDPKSNSYTLKSSIAKKGGFGNVVLDVTDRSGNVVKNKIMTIPESKITKEASDTFKGLKTKYDVKIDSFIQWTGSESDKRVYTYAGFTSFAEFIKYIRKRLQLPDSLKDKVMLDKQLVTYSGSASNYANNVRSLYKNVSIVIL